MLPMIYDYATQNYKISDIFNRLYTNLKTKIEQDYKTIYYKPDTTISKTAALLAQSIHNETLSNFLGCARLLFQLGDSNVEETFCFRYRYNTFINLSTVYTENFDFEKLSRFSPDIKPCICHTEGIRVTPLNNDALDEDEPFVLPPHSEIFYHANPLYKVEEPPSLTASLVFYATPISSEHATDIQRKQYVEAFFAGQRATASLRQAQAELGETKKQVEVLLHKNQSVRWVTHQLCDLILDRLKSKNNR